MFHLLLCYSLLYLYVFFILFVKFWLYFFQLLMNCAYTLDKKLHETPESMKEQFPSDSWLAWPSNLLSSVKIRTSRPFLFSCHSPHWRLNPKTSEFSRALPSGVFSSGLSSWLWYTCRSLTTTSSFNSFEEIKHASELSVEFAGWKTPSHEKQASVFSREKSTEAISNHSVG